MDGNADFQPTISQVKVWIPIETTTKLVGGFRYFLFSPLPGEMIQFDKHIFQVGWNHQLVKNFIQWQYISGIEVVYILPVGGLYISPIPPIKGTRKLHWQKYGLFRVAT